MVTYVEVLNILLAAIAAGVFRNVLGYLKTALEDGKISKYEWTMLGSKMVEALLLTVALTIGVGADPTQAAAGAVLLSYGRSAIQG